MHNPVDRGRGRHGILEDFIPLGEHQVARDDDGLALVSFREEREEDLHLVAVLLDVADVVDDDSIEAIEAL